MGFNSNIGRTDLGGVWRNTDIYDVGGTLGFADPERDLETGEFIRWRKGDAIVCNKFYYARDCWDGSEAGYLASPCRLVENAPMGILLINSMPPGFDSATLGELGGSVSGVYGGFIPDGPVRANEYGEAVVFKGVKDYLLKSREKQYYLVPGSYQDFINPWADLRDIERVPDYPEWWVDYSMWREKGQICRVAAQFVLVIDCPPSDLCTKAVVLYFLTTNYPPGTQEPPFYIDQLGWEDKSWKLRIQDPTGGRPRTYSTILYEGTVDQYGLLVGFPSGFGVGESEGWGISPYRLEICCKIGDEPFCPPIDMDVCGVVYPIQVANDTYRRSDRWPP